MNVEALGTEAREAIRNGLEPFADGPEMIEVAFFRPKSRRLLEQSSLHQVAGEFFVLFEKGVFPVGAEDVMAVLDLVDDGGEFPVQSLVEADTEDLADAVGGQTPQDDFAASLEDLVNGEVAFENEIPASTRSERWSRSATSPSRRVRFTRELRPRQARPVVELFADDGRTGRSAAACRAATSSTARKALSSFLKPTLLRVSSRSMKE